MARWLQWCETVSARGDGDASWSFELSKIYRLKETDGKDSKATGYSAPNPVKLVLILSLVSSMDLSFGANWRAGQVLLSYMEAPFLQAFPMEK